MVATLFGRDDRVRDAPFFFYDVNALVKVCRNTRVSNSGSGGGDGGGLGGGLLSHLLPVSLLFLRLMVPLPFLFCSLHVVLPVFLAVSVTKEYILEIRTLRATNRRQRPIDGICVVEPAVELVRRERGASGGAVAELEQAVGGCSRPPNSSGGRLAPLKVVAEYRWEHKDADV